MPDSRLRSRLFLSLVLLSGFVHFFLAARHRLPQDHDTAAAFAAFHHVISSAAHDEVPLWIPHAAHGTPSHGAIAAQDGIPTTALRALAPLLRSADLLVLHHLGSWFEELLLLAGIWCLSSRFLKSPWAVFFAAASAVGTSLGLEQAWVGVRSACAVPMAMHLLLGFAESGERWKAALASALCAFAGPMAPLIAPAATAAGVLACFALFPQPRHAFRPTRRDPVWILVVGAPWVLAALAATGAPDLVHAPSVATWAPLRLLDIPIGLLPDRDVVVFAGTVPWALALTAVLLEPRVLGRAAAIAVCVAAASALLPPYEIDALARSAPFIRMSLALAGARGLDHLLNRHAWGRQTIWIPAIGLVLTAAGLAVLSADLALGGATSRSFVQLLSAGIPADRVPRATRDPMMVSDALGMTSFLAAAASLLLLMPTLTRRTIPLAAAGLLLVHAADVFAWKLRNSWLRGTPLDAAQREHVRARPLRWIPTRSEDVSGAPAFLALKAADHPRNLGRGWTPEPFFDADPAATTLAAPHWTLPVGALGRAAGGPTPSGPFPKPPYPPAVTKAVGLAAPKLALFTQGHALDDRSAVALFANPAFPGDALILADTSGAPFDPGGSDRLDVSPEVLSFGANHLRVRVRSPHPAWLAYADAWEAGWSATVNGADVPVARVNIAYKAVKIEAGEALVEFRYRAPRRAFALAIQPWLALATALAMVVILSRLIWGMPA